MDELNNKISKKAGFTTIEMVVALAIMSLILTAVTLVAFSNQSFLIGSQTHNEAMKIAQGLLEEQQALAREDFNLVNSTTEVKEDIYIKSIVVEAYLPEVNYFQTKKVTAVVKWEDELGREKTFELVTLISNFESPAGANTCDSNLTSTDHWENPEVESTITLPAGTLVADVDVFEGRLYVAANQTTNNSDHTLYVYDVSETDNPTLEGSIDNAISTPFGLNAVQVAKDFVTDKIFAYAASNSGSSYSSCHPVDPLNGNIDYACGQLHIFDVSDGDPVRAAHLKISSSPEISGQNRATSIFYKNNYIFIGVEANSGGPEFHIIDVHNPDNINSGSMSPVGSFEIGNTVNAISLKGRYAYIASPNTEELKIIDIAAPNSLSRVGGFAEGNGNGKSLALVGAKLFFGKTVLSGSGNDELYFLNNINSEIILPKTNSLDINSSVNEIIIRDSLAFVLTNTNLHVYDIDSDPLNPPILIDSTISVNSHTTEPSMDCEGNRLYISSNSASGQGRIDIIKPGDE